MYLFPHKKFHMEHFIAYLPFICYSEIKQYCDFNLFSVYTIIWQEQWKDPLQDPIWKHKL